MENAESSTTSNPCAQIPMVNELCMECICKTAGQMHCRLHREWDVLTTQGRLKIAAQSQQHANELAISDGYMIDVGYAPFTKYEADMSSIMGAIQQSGRYLWATDTPCPKALKDLIQQGVVTFKGKNGIIAEYIKA